MGMRTYTGKYKGCKVTIYDFGNNTNEEWNNRINKLKGGRVELDLKETLKAIDAEVHDNRECKICGDKDYEVIYLRVCKKCKEGLLG